MTASEQPFDRVVVVSFQPEKRRAAQQLARAFVGALAKLGRQDGHLVMQLDELVGGSDAVVGSTPFLPPEPVALCLTGTPRLVDAVLRQIASSSKAKFARVRALVPVPVLRISAFVEEGRITIDPSRELGDVGFGVLVKAGWKAAKTNEDLESQIPLFEAEQLLMAWGDNEPTEFTKSVAPGPARKKVARRAASRPGKPFRNACPHCGHRKTLPIQYGYPLPEVEAAAVAGKIVLGGCIVGPDQPDRACPACGTQWIAGQGRGQRATPVRGGGGR